MLPQEEKTIHQWRARRRTGAVDPFGADAYNAGDVVFEFRHYSSDDVLIISRGTAENVPTPGCGAGTYRFKPDRFSSRWFPDAGGVRDDGEPLEKSVPLQLVTGRGAVAFTADGQGMGLREGHLKLKRHQLVRRWQGARREAPARRRGQMAGISGDGARVVRRYLRA